MAAGLCALLFALCVSAEAQQGTVYRVGILGPPGKLEELSQMKGFRHGLREAGYVEVKNLRLDISATKTYEELRPIAKRYVENETARSSRTVERQQELRGRQQARSPIFIWGLSDPVGMGFVKSLARPGMNSPGLSSLTSPEISGTRLEVFKEIIPSLRRVMLLYNARGENPSQRLLMDVLRNTAPKLGLVLAEKPIKLADETVDLVLSVSKESTDGIFMSSGLFTEPCKRIGNIAVQKKLPLSGYEVSGLGVLSSYEANGYSVGHRGAWYVDRILKGTKPQELPVESPTNSNW
jgi:putative ABC transport system substrate-binding protein